MNPVANVLTPRKSTVQARAAATIEALHIAAIQVLAREGLKRCTTTRIANRAGVSVGGLYQYYPNRDALLAAVLDHHLESVARAVDRVCRDQLGNPLSEMASHLVIALLDIELRHPEVSRALYYVAAERGGAELVVLANRRIVAAIAKMLRSAPHARFENPTITAAFSLSIILGAVRAIIVGYAPPKFESCLKPQIIQMVTAYLNMHQTCLEDPICDV